MARLAASGHRLVSPHDGRCAGDGVPHISGTGEFGRGEQRPVFRWPLAEAPALDSPDRSAWTLDGLEPVSHGFGVFAGAVARRGRRGRGSGGAPLGVLGLARPGHMERQGHPSGQGPVLGLCPSRNSEGLLGRDLGSLTTAAHSGLGGSGGFARKAHRRGACPESFCRAVFRGPRRSLVGGAYPGTRSPP